MKKTKNENITSNVLIENYAFVTSLLRAVFVTALAVILISFIPVDTDVTKYTDLILPGLIKDCMPEPLEMIQYATTIILMPITFLISYSAIIKKTKSLESFGFYGLTEGFVVSLILILYIAVYLVVYSCSPGSFNFKIYHAFICIIIAAVFVLLCKKAENIKSKKVAKILLVFAWAAIVSYGFYRLSSINYMLQDRAYCQHHFYAWWYPVYKVYSGNTIGVNFNNIYGFYPYIVVPVLKVLGGVNQNSVSLFYALAEGFIATAYFVFCYRFIKNKLLAFIAAFASSVYGPLAVLGETARRTKNYFQYQPTRTLFIAVCLMAVSLYCTANGSKIKAIIKLIMIPVLGVGLMWNLEMGIVSIVIWAGFIVLESAIKNNLISKMTLAAVVKAVLSSVASILVCIVVVELITYLRAGCLIGKNDFIFGMICFEGTGFFMLPLTLGTWVPIWLPFMAGVIVVLPYLISKRPATALSEKKLVGVFIVSISGLGAFIYYMGRSVPTNEFSYLPYSAMCYALLYEYYVERIKKFKSDKQASDNIKKVIFFERIKSFVCIYMVSVVFLLASFYFENSFHPEYKANHNTENSSELVIVKPANDIKAWADEKNNGVIPNILTYYNSYFNEVLGRASSENVCDRMDWFFKTNAHTYIEFINSHSDESFVIDENSLIILNECFPQEWNEIVNKFDLSEQIIEFDNNHKYSHIYFYTPKDI